MLGRYTLPDMGQIWSEESKFRSWLQVEQAVCEAYEHYGQIPEGVTERILQGASFTIDRIEEIEKTIAQDMIAFVKCVSENLDEEAQRALHYGMTSYDIEDTALAVRLRDASDLIIADIEALLPVIADLARKHKMTPMIGRTHGVHAEPITFGFKIAVWYSELQRDLKRVKDARDAISVGKISGAVGIFGNVDPRIEEYVCEKLGLKPAPVSTQIIQRDRHAQLISSLAILATGLDNYATEMRNLQRTEILEVQEMFLPGQRGSSAMPHKRNPWRFESICGLARLVRGDVVTALEDMVSWHERDLANSAPERILFEDDFCVVDFMLQSLAKLMGKLEIKSDNMKKNLGLMGNLAFSEHVMLALIRTGLTRDEAYTIVQRNCARVWDEKIDFREALEQDEDVNSRLNKAQIDLCFDLDHHLRNVDTIYERLGLKAAA